MPRSALIQPLSLRRDYGSSEEREEHVAESGLPDGGEPAQKGLSLDKDIPGTSTFNKPEDDKRQFDKSPPGSEYRRDTPDDMAKPQDSRKDDERDMGYIHPEYTDPGGRPPGDQSITKYPYRSDPRGKPNEPDRKYKHYASVPLVVERHLLKTAPRVATRLDVIEQGLNPKVVDRSNKCSVTLKRADIPNMRWLFSVDCGNGPKVVRVHADKGRASKLSKMDLHLSCSCPAWRWLGSEHWSKGEQYLDGNPRGTASEPVIRDPQGINRVCKHVAAVLSNIRNWQVGPKREVVKQAMIKRACNVCVAAEVLRTASLSGYEVRWREAPSGTPSVYVRAMSAGPEFKPAKYQVRRAGEAWPQDWLLSTDLAGDMSVLGFDIQWEYVPPPVQSWVTGSTPMQTLKEACLIWRK